MALGGPNIYPGVLSWLGLQRELTVGTPLTPAYTHPVEQNQFEPEDTPRFLKDNAIRGAMTDLFYETLGVESATFSFGGPNFLDTHGYFMDNVFGDLSSTGSSPTSPSTCTSALNVGATGMTLSATPAAYTTNAIIQIDTGTVSEVVIISGTAAGNVINFVNNPTRFTHTTSSHTIATNVVAAPFTHRFAALNSQLGYGGAFGAQPPTHTFTDVTNIVNTYTSATYGTAPTNTYGARAYPSAVVQSMDFSGNAEQLLNIRLRGQAWLSTVATSSPVLTTTNSRPIPNWNTTVNILGNTIATIGEFSYNFVRTTQVYWTVQGIQTPYVIARGPLNMNGSVQWDPTTTEQPLDMMLLNAQGGMTITTSNTTPAFIPNAGTAFTLIFAANQVANIKSKIMRNKALIGYNNSFEGVANSTDVGGSGGLGPGTLTLINGIPTY